MSTETFGIVLLSFLQSDNKKIKPDNKKAITQANLLLLMLKRVGQALILSSDSKAKVIKLPVMQPSS